MQIKNRDNITVNHVNDKIKMKVICLNCGRDIYNSKKYGNQNQYCSSQCHVEYKWKLKFKKMDSTEDLGEYYTRARRKYYIYKYGCKCFICNNTEWMGKSIPVELDHIDGNSNNNMKPNLRLVCLNCGGQLPTYKGRNKCSGRHYGRQRYRYGKSF